MKGAKVDEPRTEAGRRLVDDRMHDLSNALGTAAQGASRDPYNRQVAAIEAEARSAALQEVEEAATRLLMPPHIPQGALGGLSPRPRCVDIACGATGREPHKVGCAVADVLAAIARLQEKSA